MVVRVVALACLLLCISPLAGDAAAVRNGDLLYVRPLGGNAPPWGRLFVSPPSGSEARDITPPGILDVQSAVWSPDGSRIAISALPDGGTAPEIYVLQADGGGLRRLTDNFLSDRQPAWSPDGRSIAFASARTGLFQIFSMRADGSRQRRLTDQAEDCETPAWSPNGRWIVASCQLGWWKLVRLRPDGSGERRMLPGYPLNESAPGFAPDGAIVFARGAENQPVVGSTTCGSTGAGFASSVRTAASLPCPRMVA